MVWEGVLHCECNFRLIFGWKQIIFDQRTSNQMGFEDFSSLVPGTIKV